MAMLSLDANRAFRFGLAVMMFSVTAWPLAMSHSAVCSATMFMPHASSVSWLPLARAWPLMMAITP